MALHLASLWNPGLRHLGNEHNYIVWNLTKTLQKLTLARLLILKMKQDLYEPEFSLNPLSPKSDQSQYSPNNIIT